MKDGNAQDLAKKKLFQISDQVFAKIESDKLSEAASKWWNEFVKINNDRPELILRLVYEVDVRDCKLQDLFSAYVWSNRDDIKGILKYMDDVLDFKMRTKSSEEFVDIAKKIHNLNGKLRDALKTYN